MWDDGKQSSAKRKKNVRRRGATPSVLMVEPRSNEKRQFWRQRWTSVFVITLAVAVVVWGVLMGTQSLGRLLFTNNEVFTVRELVLKSDGALATPARLREWAGVSEGMNMFDLSIEAVQGKLEGRIPIIEKAVVRRELPDRLVIEVTERQALARLGKDRHGIPLAIDRHGYLLGPSSRKSGLPVVVGHGQAGMRPGKYVGNPEMQKALEALTICDTTRVGNYLDIITVGIGNPEFLDIRLRNGERILLGPDQMEQRLRKVAAILQASKQKGMLPQIIDATGSHNYPVQYQ